MYGVHISSMKEYRCCMRQSFVLARLAVNCQRVFCLVLAMTLTRGQIRCHGQYFFLRHVVIVRGSPGRLFVTFCCARPFVTSAFWIGFDLARFQSLTSRWWISCYYLVCPNLWSRPCGIVLVVVLREWRLSEVSTDVQNRLRFAASAGNTGRNRIDCVRAHETMHSLPVVHSPPLPVSSLDNLMNLRTLTWYA